MFKRKRDADPSPAEGLHKLVFGDVPLDEWTAQADGEPMGSFERARQLVRADRQDEAIAIWRQIADTEGESNRVTPSRRVWCLLCSALCGCVRRAVTACS